MGNMNSEQHVQQEEYTSAHVEIADHHEWSETALIYAVRVIPGGAATIALIVLWAVRQKIRGWIVKVVSDAVAKAKGNKS